MSDVENNATDDSLRDDLAAAMAGTSQEVTNESTEVQAERPGPIRDETGRFAKQDGEQKVLGSPKEKALDDGEAATSSGISEQPVDTSAAMPPKAPQSWRQEVKEAFSSLDPRVQQEILRREADFNKGIQRYAESAKYAESIKPVFDKWQPYLNQLQVTPDKAFDALIQAEYQLRTGSPIQKQQAFMKLAQDYGIDLNQFSGEQPQLDPNLQHALSRVQQLEETIRNQQYTQQQEVQRKQQAEQAALQQQIEAFSSSPERPHFEQVRDDMAKLLQAGYAETLEDAYEKAVWARPDIRSTLLKDEEAKRIQEKAKVAEQAKAKAVSVTGTPSGASIPVPNASIRDDIIAAMGGAGRL